jgi:hypothetical protein
LSRWILDCFFTFCAHCIECNDAHHDEHCTYLRLLSLVHTSIHNAKKLQRCIWKHTKCNWKSFHIYIKRGSIESKKRLEACFSQSQSSESSTELYIQNVVCVPSIAILFIYCCS